MQIEVGKRNTSTSSTNKHAQGTIESNATKRNSGAGKKTQHTIRMERQTAPATSMCNSWIKLLSIWSG